MIKTPFSFSFCEDLFLYICLITIIRLASIQIDYLTCFSLWLMRRVNWVYNYVHEASLNISHFLQLYRWRVFRHIQGVRVSPSPTKLEPRKKAIIYWVCTLETYGKHVLASHLSNLSRWKLCTFSVHILSQWSCSFPAGSCHLYALHAGTAARRASIWLGEYIWWADTGSSKDRPVQRWWQDANLQVHWRVHVYCFQQWW